jgi:hypothetical protein
MKLPNGEDAIVDVAKLRDYSLSPHHVDGLHKARVFRAALGLEQQDVPELRAALLQAAADGDAIYKGYTQHGWQYMIDLKW